MAKPKVFMILVSRQSEPLTEVQIRGIGSVLGNKKMSFTAWPGGCAVAAPWEGTANELLEKVKSAIGTNDSNIGVLQLGPDTSSFGTAAFNETVRALAWLVS